MESKLFTPLKVGDYLLNHRIVLAPCTRMRCSPDGILMSDAATYYEQRTTPGGLLISEGSFIAHEAGGLRYCAGIYSSEHVQAWRRVTQAVHSKGGVIFCQLWALGRVAHADQVRVIYSPSSLPKPKPKHSDWSRPTDEGIVAESKDLTVMTGDDIIRFVLHFRRAAELAKEAGFDGVELHGANGYLLDQFLQSKSNDRADNYGGSPGGRMRFALEVISAVCSVFGEGRVGVRISPFSTYQGMRESDPLSLFVPYVQRILEHHPNLAYIHALEPRAMDTVDVRLEDMIESDTLDPIRDLCKSKNVAFITAGGWNAANALSHTQQQDDLIAFGRHFISNPDLVYRVKKGLAFNQYDRSTFYTQTAQGYTEQVYRLPVQDRVKLTRIKLSFCKSLMLQGQYPFVRETEHPELPEPPKYSHVVEISRRDKYQTEI